MMEWIKQAKIYVLLHLFLMVYSLSGVCSKKAAGTRFLSGEFILYYGTVILLLGVYAICWQQVIKRLPLTTAYSNKAITLVWGIIWGVVFFNESVTIGKIVGAVIVIIGVIVYSHAEMES